MKMASPKLKIIFSYYRANKENRVPSKSGQDGSSTTMAENQIASPPHEPRRPCSNCCKIGFKCRAADTEGEKQCQQCVDRGLTSCEISRSFLKRPSPKPVVDSSCSSTSGGSSGVDKAAPTAGFTGCLTDLSKAELQRLVVEVNAALIARGQELQRLVEVSASLIARGQELQRLVRGQELQRLVRGQELQRLVGVSAALIARGQELQRLVEVNTALIARGQELQLMLGKQQLGWKPTNRGEELQFRLGKQQLGWKPTNRGEELQFRLGKQQLGWNPTNNTPNRKPFISAGTPRQ